VCLAAAAAEGVCCLVAVVVELGLLTSQAASAAAVAAVTAARHSLLVTERFASTTELFSARIYRRLYHSKYVFGSEMAATFHPLVFSGPSGTGKSTLVQRLVKEHPGCFAFCISRTLISFSSFTDLNAGQGYAIGVIYISQYFIIHVIGFSLIVID
jgi:hypothetical protein